MNVVIVRHKTFIFHPEFTFQEKKFRNSMKLYWKHFIYFKDETFVPHSVEEKTAEHIFYRPVDFLSHRRYCKLVPLYHDSLENQTDGEELLGFPPGVVRFLK